MKMKPLHLLLLVFFAFSISFAQAQITITSSNIAQFYATGNTITESFDTIVNTYDVGLKGAGNNWDFSASGLDTESQMIVDPAATPASETFPDANIAFQLDFEEEGVTGLLYNYLELTSSGLIFHGSFGSSSSEGDSFEQITTNNPAQEELPLPLTFGDSWDYDGTQTISTTFDGGTFSLESDIMYNSTVDAYGSITFPDGSTSQALRIRESRTVSSEIVPGFPTTSTSVSFIFLAQNGDILSINASAASPSDEGTVQGTLSWSSAGNVSSAKDLLAQGFYLAPVSPNPIQDQAQLRYELPEAERIQVQLFDMKGRSVETLFQGRQAAGEHNLHFSTTNLPAGQYILSLTAKNGVLSQSIVVQR